MLLKFPLRRMSCRNIMRLFTLILSLLCIGARAELKTELLKDKVKLEAKANAGDVEAQRSLGYSYLRGSYETCNIINYSEGYKWLKKAASSGSVDAQCDLGDAYYEGVGAPVNKAEAAKWYSMAVKFGKDNAIIRLAEMYRDGDGVKVNLIESYALYSLKGGVYEKDPSAPVFTPEVVAAGQKRLMVLQKIIETNMLQNTKKVRYW